MPMTDTDPRHASSGATLASAPPNSVTEIHTVVDPRLARRGLQAQAQSTRAAGATAAALAPTAAEEPSGTSTASTFVVSPFQLEDSPSTAPQPTVPELACMPLDPRTGRSASTTASAAVDCLGGSGAPLTLSDDQPITLPAPLYPESLFSSDLPPFTTPLAPTAGAPTAGAPTAVPDATLTAAAEDLGPPTAAVTPAAAADPKQIRRVPSTAPHPLDRDPDDPSLAPKPEDFTHRKITYSFQGCPLPCEALFTKATPEHVLDLIGDSIACDLQFNCSRRLALCILHVLNRGLSPFMRMRPLDEHAARTTFDSTFERILATERDPPLPVTCVAEGSEAFEILFVPMHDLVSTKGADGKWSYNKVPCFWCYRVVPGALAAAIKWLSMNRLPVVLDLDDTLVVANGEGALRDKRDKAKVAITKLQKVLEASKKEDKDDSDASSSGAAAPIQKKISILTKEVAILEQDIKMVREYIEDDVVTDEHGDVHVAQMEAAFTEPTGDGGEIERPVIRLMRGEDYVTVFTRIDPANANTSMIIRVRAGWEKLKQELMATLESSGLRKWDTYVCTAAEMRYALEVCRILDPEGDVFNRASLHHHLVCVSRANKKSLKAALHHPLDVNRYKADASELEDPDDVDQDDGVQEDDQGPSGVPTMSVAIIVDDRIDVWESGVREQIVVASQFNHYPTAAAHACGEGIGTSRRGHNEVARILNFLTGIRRDLFHFWDNCLSPTVRQLLARGVPNALYITDMHEMMAASPYVNVKSMLPSTALPLPPDSMGSRENQDSQTFAPVDPRKRRELAAQNAAAAARAHPPQNFTLTALQPPQGAPPTAVISLQPVLRGARTTAEGLHVFPPPLPPPTLGGQMPSPGPVPFISAASLPTVPAQPPSGAVQLTPAGLALQPAQTFSAVPQDPRRARASNSGATATGAAMNALPPPVPLAPGAPPGHVNTSLMPLPPPGAFLGAHVKPQSPDGVPGLQGATDGVTKQEEKIQSEHTDSDMKLSVEDKGSIDASMELLYSGGEVKHSSVADTAAEVKDESRKGVEAEGGELDDGEIEGSDDENGKQGGVKAAAKAERESSADSPGTWRSEAGVGGDRGARRKEEASYWEEDSWWGWDDEDEGHWSHNQGPAGAAAAPPCGWRAAAPPADDEESKQRLQEKLWTLGQGGLPFVVVGQDTSRNCFRPLKVQQNPVIASWAPFLKKGDVVPAIAVDPDPAKRPECIVIRIDGSMVNQTCALNQNYHFLLSDQMQSKYTFTGSQKTHTLPPWVLLDLDSQRHAVTDLHASFQQQHAPMPALNSNDIIHRAMGEWYSFYLRKPFPDIPSGGSVDLSTAESTNKTPAMTTAAANESISKLMRASLSPGNGFRPINLPQDVIQQMVDNESAAADGWFEVGGPEGKQTVAVLHLHVGHEDDMTVHHALVQTPVSASERPFGGQVRGGDRPGPPGKAPAREVSPGVARQAATAAKRKRGAPGEPGADVDIAGPGPGGAAGATKAARSAARGVDDKSLLWCDQPRGANPISFLYEKGQAMQVAVEFQDRIMKPKDGAASGSKGGTWVEFDVFWGEAQHPIGSASARTKKEAKRLAAIDALEYLDETGHSHVPMRQRDQAGGERFAAWRERKAKRAAAGYAGEDDWAGEAGEQEGGNSRRERDTKRTRLASDSSTTAAGAAASTGGYSSAIASLAAQALGTTGFAGMFGGLGKDVAGGSASTKGYGGSTGGYGAAKQAAAAKQGKLGAIGSVAPSVGKSTVWSSRLATGGYGGGYGGTAGGSGADQSDLGKATGSKSSSAVDGDDIAAKVKSNGGAERKLDAKATIEPDSEEEDGEILSDEET